MKCPKCKESINHRDCVFIDSLRDASKNYVDVHVICDHCDIEFFGRVTEDDLIEIE
jgi:hypothetical protein